MVTLCTGKPQSNVIMGVRKPDGTLTWTSITMQPLFQPGEIMPYAVVTSFSDISEWKQTEEKLRYLNTHDILTGLYNCTYFEEEMSRLEHGRQFPISVLMVDVDDLKTTNDTQGHVAGDELLRRTALVLRTAFRSEDIVARIGGDEFAVLLPGADATAAEEALLRLRNTWVAHDAAYGRSPLSFSVGVATAEKSHPLSEVLEQADTRMYREKLTWDGGKPRMEPF